MSAKHVEILEVIDDLVPHKVHVAAWKTCMRDKWYFGHVSEMDPTAVPFWKMKLKAVESIDDVWNHARKHCEKLTGRELHVIRQYAAGHSYGMGGRIHVDDAREGAYTLLYYPMPVWEQVWEGETVFYDSERCMKDMLLPLPNRGIFFESRIAHGARAPSRFFSGLRVAVVFKLSTFIPAHDEME